MRPARPRLAAFSAAILAALAAVLAVLLPSGIASAATVTAAGNRVWAISPAAQDHVRADRLVSAGEHLGDPAPCPFCAPGACAAPEGVMLDSGTARAIASDTNSAVRSRLMAQLGGRDMYMTQTAADEFTSAVSRLAGPMEKSAADQLMSQVTVVADNPSLRAAALTVTKRLGANDIQIFGTADNMGIPIFTSDLNALRGAYAQGVEFDAIVHPPFSFLGY